MASAADNGSLYFWDWNSGYNFQQIHSPAQPGSISAEAGIFDATFINLLLIKRIVDIFGGCGCATTGVRELGEGVAAVIGFRF